MSGLGAAVSRPASIPAGRGDAVTLPHRTCNPRIHKGLRRPAGGRSAGMEVA